MNEKEEIILFNLTVQLLKSTKNLIDSLNHLPDDLQKIIITPPPSLQPTRKYILKILFPHLFHNQKDQP